MQNNYTRFITDYPDFPAPGVLFRDISPLLFDVATRNEVLEKFGSFIQENKIDVIAGVDARGFILGGFLAERYQLPFIMIRKSGKLPEQAVIRESYQCEYSEATLVIKKDIVQNRRVCVIDDVLATGGTLQAALRLAKSAGASEVFGGVLIELLSLKGREKLSEYEMFSAIQYE